MKKIYKVIAFLWLILLFMISISICSFAHECEYVVYADGTELRATCEECGEDAPCYLEILSESGCKHDQIYVDDTEWKELGLPEYVIVFNDGDNYSTEFPKEEDCYYVSLMSLSEYEEGVFDGDSLTEGIEFTYCHSWEYTVKDYTINACCEYCGEKGFVTIDTSAVFDPTKVPLESSNYELVYEENWSNHIGIESYSVFFDGYEILGRDKAEAKYINTTRKPSLCGSYSVHIALGYDLGGSFKETYSTKKKPYYIANISYDDIEIESYTDEYAKTLTTPVMLNGAYQVGTLEELLWCVYNINTTSYTTISFTNDIVVNPMVVSEEGEIFSASYSLYFWEGIGSKDAPFNGEILGNGYSIYGLYVLPENEDIFGGLISYGGDVTILDLTIENCYIGAFNAGSFAGSILGKLTIENCCAQNNFIFGDNIAGGFVGKVGCADVYDVVLIKNGVNDSYVQGLWAGGFVGRTDEDNRPYSMVISGCSNFGIIIADNDAGGIIGSLFIGEGGGCSVKKCLNIGQIESSNFAGGIIGLYSENDTSKNPIRTLDITDCCHIGEINAEISSALIGKFEQTTPGGNSGDYLYINKCYYFGTDKGLPTNAKGSCVKLSSEQIANNLVCEIFGHKNEKHYYNVVQPSCTENGHFEIVCRICQKVLEEPVTLAHGHVYEWGATKYACIYCGATMSNSTGSIIDPVSMYVVVAIVVILVGAAAIYLVIRNRKSKNVA